MNYLLWNITLWNTSISHAITFFLDFNFLIENVMARISDRKWMALSLTKWANLLWEHAYDRRGFYCVSWEWVCMPQSHGGLGLVNLTHGRKVGSPSRRLVQPHFVWVAGTECSINVCKNPWSFTTQTSLWPTPLNMEWVPLGFLCAEPHSWGPCLESYLVGVHIPSWNDELNSMHAFSAW